MLISLSETITSDSTGLDATPPPPVLNPQGMTATGGVISDYVDGPIVYRAHVFTVSGTFDVTELSNDPGTLPDEVDYLLVGGGGGGGGFAKQGDGGGGGGGGGAIRYATDYPVSVQSYTVTVGGGGVAAADSTDGGLKVDHQCLDLDQWLLSEEVVVDLQDNPV